MKRVKNRVGILALRDCKRNWETIYQSDILLDNNLVYDYWV